jgi:acetylornithine deacetylase
MNFLSVTELLKKLISFESLSTKEKEIADWVESYSKSIPNVKVTRIQDNILIRVKGKQESELLFNTHLDVVPASPNHNYPAFEPFERDGKIYGRGSTDAKGSLACMLTALTEFRNSKNEPNHTLLFAFTACEESYGDFNGVSELKKLGYFENVFAGIVGEPTSLAPCIAQKGILLIDIVLRGTSGHAARIPVSENLLYALPECLERLKQVDMGKINPWIGPVKITPTRIIGGTANNMAPEEIRITIDIRTIPEVSSQEIISAIQHALPEAEIVVRSDRFKAVSTNADHRIAILSQEISGKPAFGSPTCSDWAFLGEIPIVKMGPGHSEQSHTANESIEIEQLEKGKELYLKLMQQF